MPLKCAIEHGVVFNDYIWWVDLATRMPRFLCGSPQHAMEFEIRTVGKTRAEAIRCLKRRLSDVVYRTLTEDLRRPHPAAA
jgi:hypothetical protein